jgi:hypothetical protein
VRVWSDRAMRIAILLVLVMLSPAAAAGQDGERRRNLAGERFAVVLTVLPDGAVDVREETVIRVGRQTETRFERVIPSVGRADGVSDIVARRNGVVSPQGRGNGQVEVSTERSVRVLWRFAAVSNAVQTFSLQYRLARAVAPRGGRGLFRWPAVPGRRAYSLAHASIAFEAPPGLVFYDGTGVEEAGWTVARRANGFVAEKDGLERGDGGTFLAELSIDGLTLVEPQWRFDEQRAASLMPAFLSGAIFILVVGAGILWIVRFQHPSTRVRASQADQAEAHLPAALAVAVAARRLPNHESLALGTFADLIRTGVLRVTSRDKVKLHPHEELLLELVKSAEHAPALSFDGLRTRLAGAAGRFRGVVIDDLLAGGYADRDRIAAARGLMRGGLVVILLAAASLSAILVWMPRFGAWPLAIPSSIAAVGLALVIRGAAFPILTPAGERASAGWRRRLKWMRGLKPSSPTPQDEAAAGLAKWLPLAAAAGQGDPWAKKFGVKGGLAEALGLGSDGGQTGVRPGSDPGLTPV